MAHLAVLPTVFPSQCSKRFHLSSEEKHGRAISSVANSQRLFHLSQQQRHFCHESYLVPARTQLFHHKYGFTNCHFANFLVYVVSTYAESLLVLHDCPVTALAIAHVQKFSTIKFLLGSKFCGGNHP